MHHGVDTTTTYHALIGRLDNNMWSLLNNVQVNNRANCGVSLMWLDMIVICRDQLSGVSLVATNTISGVYSTIIDAGILGVMEVPSIKRWGASSSVEVSTSAS